jgi:hypothetical protein
MPLESPGRKSKLSISEMVTISVWFLRSKVKDFKTFYEGCQGKFLREYFPSMPDYSNFLKQKKRQAKAFFSLAQREEKSGFLLIDSTPLPACENIRANRHRTFRGVANLAPFFAKNYIWSSIEPQRKNKKLPNRK